MKNDWCVAYTLTLLITIRNLLSSLFYLMGFPGGSDGKESALQETWVLSLGREDTLEKGMATFSSSLAWRIPWTEVPGELYSMGSQRIRHD